MALLPTGSRTTSGGVSAAIRKHSKNLNLVPAKKIVIKFDPFGENHPQMRQFIYLMNGKRILQTNPYCRVLTEITCDRSEPSVEILLTTGNTVTLKCSNLTVLDMVKICNEHVSALAPKEETSSNVEVVKIRKR